MGRIVSDGRAYQTDAAAARAAGDYVVEDGFHGLVMAAAALGEQVALDISQREIEVTGLPAGVGITLGADLFLSTNGTFGNAVGGVGTGTWYRVGKISRARDANGVAWFVQAAQSAGTAT